MKAVDLINKRRIARKVNVRLHIQAHIEKYNIYDNNNAWTSRWTYLILDNFKI